MNDIVRKKNYPLSFPTDVLDIIKQMSMTDGKDIAVMGSMGLRSQQYAGDYDLLEEVNGSYKSEDTALDAYVRKFQSIIKHFLHREDCYIGDIKSGEIPEWKVIPDSMNQYSYTKSLKQLTSLHQSKIISKEDYDDAKEYLKKVPSTSEFIVMKKSIRFHIVRWTPNEVLGGAKRLQDGRTYWLKDAFASPSLTKLDIVALVQNNRFTDFSCIYLFKNNGKILNNVPIDEKGIQEDIVYFMSEGNWFKVAKRLFALAKIQEDKTKLVKLNEMLNGDLGRLYSIISDANTILFLLENESDIPIAKIRYEIDQFRSRLANIYTLQSYIRREPSILQKLLTIQELPNTPDGRKKLESAMERLVEFFQVILDKKSKFALDNLGLLK